jgi:outer membrane protein assembly factor BamE (lipoprotein component of BamABCDE complex)
VNNRLAILALFLLLLTGCASARRGIGDNLEAQKIINIIPGQTTRSEIRMIFGKPDIAKEHEDGTEEYTYIQGRNDSVSWLILSGYLVYHPTTAFSGNRILIVYFENDKVKRYFATDGKLTLKKPAPSGRGKKRERRK